MKLENIAEGAAPVPLAFIGADDKLTRQLQGLLATVGLLDPPIDGQFGPVSQWALSELLKRLDFAKANVIDASLARALLKAADADPFPVKQSSTMAGRLVQALQKRAHWIQRHPACINIVYVEGMDPDGKPNPNAPNEFNDVRCALRITASGLPEIVEVWDATTEPGMYHTVIEPLDSKGAARIAFGQYKAWSVGIHHSKKKQNSHEALVQSASITVHRDLDKDFKRTKDKTFPGMFSINQHCGYDMKKSDIGRASAGCLVGRTRAGHASFMKLCKADPRYLASHSYRFMTAVMPSAIMPAA